MKINDLNLKEKIGQMLIIGLDFENPMEKIDDIILNVKPGGILLYKKNYKTYEEMIEFINYIKTLNSKVNKIPLFIAVIFTLRRKSLINISLLLPSIGTLYIF